MTNIVDSELQYLVHFFNDKAHLFKTITMADPCLIDEISNTIATQKGWYWFRYRQGDRIDYLARRLFVERELYKGYTREFGPLKEKVPVYFYLFPNITKKKALDRRQIKDNGAELMPQVLLVKIEDIADIQNVTFTVNDSFGSYWKKAIDAGIKCRTEEKDRVVLEDHNKVFPFSMIYQIHQKYKAREIVYEVQIWDHELLSKMKYEVLKEE